MGTLAQGMGFTSASSAAQNSLNWTAAGGTLNAAGSILSGVGQAQQYNYRAAVAANNAQIARANAGADINAGQYEGSASLLRTGETIGQQRAAFGANNIDVNTGSAARVQESTRTIGAMDAALIHYNAARAAYGENVQAAADIAQSKLDRLAAAGAAESGLFTAGSGLLSTASSLAGKAASYRLSFGDNAPGGG